MAKRQILDSILHPIGSSRISILARGKKRVLIITDDFTRQTPLKEILPVILKELKIAGIEYLNISILIASGTHRQMSKNELVVKFGKRIVNLIEIHNHSWNKDSALTSISEKINGKKICVNRLIKKSDFIIGIGSIVPHATTGFSGGGKIILPGICGKETTEDMHWKALDFKIKDILGVYDNPMRRMVDSVAKKVGLKFIVNIVCDPSGKVAGAVAGDPIKAHRKGVELSKKVYGIKFSSPAEIVVADASPMDMDLRQAIKAVAAADIVVKNGGVIILVSRCPEGVSRQFPEFLKFGFQDPEGLKKKIESGKVKGKLMAYTLIAIGRVMQKAKVILVSKGVRCQMANKMGFLWCSSVDEAIQKAKELNGAKSKIVYLKRACEILPLMN